MIQRFQAIPIRKVFKNSVLTAFSLTTGSAEALTHAASFYKHVIHRVGRKAIPQIISLHIF